MQTPKVYVIILNYRRWQDTCECLESVLRSDYSNFSVFVIDNNSGNNSLEHLSTWFASRPFSQDGRISPVFFTQQQLSDWNNVAELPKVVFVQNDKNTGFGAGNNVILKFLQDENAYFWLLNPDMVVETGTMGELVRYATQLPAESIVGTVIKSWAGNHKLITYGGFKVNFSSATITSIKRPDLIHQLDYISGGCLFSHFSSLNKIGLLPEKYFLYWEETDWCYKAKQEGYGLYVCKSATCYDKGSTTIGKNFVADYYYTRNGLSFISKFKKKNISLVFFFLGVRFLKRVFTGRWGRAKGIYKGTTDYFKMQTNEFQ